MTIAVAESTVLADRVPGSVVRDIALVVGAAVLTGLAAQLSVHIPGTPVPVTGQTAAVLLTGAALGARRSIAAMSVYLLGGLAGLPWFANHSAGYVGATFGYLVGFVVAGAVVGWLAGRGGDRRMSRALGTMVIGNLVIYGIGLLWLATDLHVNYAVAWRLGMRPFLVGDALKILLTASILPVTWRILSRHS